MQNMKHKRVNGADRADIRSFLVTNKREGHHPLSCDDICRKDQFLITDLTLDASVIVVGA
jgi:hypothetical protein